MEIIHQCRGHTRRIVADQSHHHVETRGAITVTSPSVSGRASNVFSMGADFLSAIELARVHPETNSECLHLGSGVAISRMLCLRAACYWLSA